MPCSSAAGPDKGKIPLWVLLALLQPLGFFFFSCLRFGGVFFPFLGIFWAAISNRSRGSCRSAFSVSWWWFWCGSSARGSHSSSLCLQGEAPFPLLQQLRAPGGAARRRGPAHGGPEQNQLKEFCHGETQQLINWAPRPRVFPEGFSHGTSGAERRLRRRQGQVKAVSCVCCHTAACVSQRYQSPAQNIFL